MEIAEQLQDIQGESDLASRALKISLLVASLFREIGLEIVVVGGSAVEFYTNGDYMSGDVDVCFHLRPRPPLRTISEIMGRLGATGGPRSFKVAGLFVDILGEVESLASTKYRVVKGADATQHVLVAKPEDLLAERMLTAIYPSKNEEARACAKKLVSACLSGTVEVDWEEALRVAALPEYKVEKELRELIVEVKSELQPNK